MMSLTASERNLIVYYAKWSTDHPRYPLAISDIPPDLVTDFVYAFIDVDEKGNISISLEEKKQLLELKKLKEKARLNSRQMRTIFSVGGWGEGSEPLPAMAHDPESRANFAKQARKFCEKYHFDGVDIDWEFPQDEREGMDLFQLIFSLYRELKQSFSKKYMITIAAPGLPVHYKRIPWGYIAPLVDRVSVMTYDLHGPWKDADNLVTNHQSALKPTIIGNPAFNTTSTMSYYSNYVPKEKLAVGIPLFFNTYADVHEGILPSHYGSPYSGPAKNPYVPYEQGNLFYRDIVEALQRGQASGYWDPVALAFMAYYPKTAIWGSGMNKQSIQNVCEFIIKNGFQGAKVWQFQGDTPHWEALRLIHQLLITSENSE